MSIAQIASTAMLVSSVAYLIAFICFAVLFWRLYLR